ncbi:MAG: GNAT family N-acetyltransferase [Tepidisphaeraceae bacterium]
MNSSSLKIEVVRSSAADSLLADEGFCIEWAALAAACPWGTPFQEPGFARCWYKVYRNQFAPLLVLSRSADGTLQGLLPLAVSPRADRLVHVGAHQAEYQTWIALPEHGNRFIWQAVKTLRREVPKANLSFRYLPKDAPIEWLHDPAAQRTCLLRQHPRPLMVFGDGSDVKESLGKRGNKSRFRRMERLGKAEFLRIDDPATFEAMLDDVVLFYDSRRLAVNGMAPFANDPLKRPFHLEMMKVPGLLHVTALTCGGRIASFHLNTRYRRHVQLSLITHNPLLAEFSPGKFHVLMLAKMLMEEGGCEWIDLTPGGDPYKERFANAWDHVYTLTVFRSSSEKRKAALIESLQDRTKRALTRWNIRPAQAKEKVIKYARLGPIGLPVALVKHALGRFGRPQEASIYSRDVAKAGNGEAPQVIRRDAIEDLMVYQPINGGPTRHEFLSDALRRIEDGQRVYTYAEDGRLLHCAWFAPEPPKELIGKALPGFDLPANSGLVVDCYTFPSARGRGLGSASLAAMLRDASEVKDLARTFIAVPCGSEQARRIVERAGFAFERSCLRRFSEM